MAYSNIDSTNRDFDYEGYLAISESVKASYGWPGRTNLRTGNSGSERGGNTVDQNLAGAVAVTLIQPWYMPYLTVLGGAIAASIGAAAVFYTTGRAQKNEKAQLLRKERKKAYVDFLFYSMKLELGEKFEDDDFYAAMRSKYEIELIGSPEIISLIHQYNPIRGEKKTLKPIRKKLVALMGNELQEKDIYIEVAGQS